MRAWRGLEPTNEFRNLPEQEKKQDMNVKKIVILSVISFLVAFSSCNTFKIPLKSHEKIGKKGEDYTISYYELKKEIVGLLHIKVIEDNKSFTKR